MRPPRQNAPRPHRERSHDRSPSIGPMMREVLHRLGDIDVEYEIRLDEVERSCADQEVKARFRRKITAAHRERRAPYVALLASLRQREHRLSFDS